MKSTNFFHQAQTTALSIIDRAANNLASQRRQKETQDAVLFARRIAFDPDEWQADVLVADEKRIILNCCRQSGKSSVTSILATHRAMFAKGSLTLVASPSERQSAETLRKIRENFQSLPDAPDFDTDAVLKFETANGSRVIALPNAVKNLRGFSKPDLIIIDEAAFVGDDLFHALSPMLAVNPDAKLILLSTPNGRRGQFWKIWTEGDEDEWLKIKVTANACPRISPVFLESEKASMPEFLYRQEYECAFVDSDTQIFPSELIQSAIDDSIRAYTW